MFKEIKERCDILIQNFHEISSERKALLEKLSQYIYQKKASNSPIQLNYICTHNSRRSHLGQVWAAVAANYYGIENVSTFSGGTQATAFNPNAIQALITAGFKIEKNNETENPIYHVFYDENNFSICFSKTFDDKANPNQNFAAVMTCSDADENCPFIVGCDIRIGSTYNDPKAYDNSIIQNDKYTERSHQIAMECLYVFSKINQYVK
ncbi:MAG: protein-tyrosine-phosphatase [Bacteroidota bacterium]|nr:protein-tyrosine-phosphatase [Bacteroidota bacterium]